MNFVRLMVISLLLAGCAPGSQAFLRNLESINALNVMPAQAEDHDYVVLVRNIKDLGWGFDLDDKATRHETALRTLATQCPDGKIVGETVINTGQYAVAGPARTYAVQVLC